MSKFGKLMLKNLLEEHVGSMVNVQVPSLLQVLGGMVLGKEMQKEEDCWSFVIKESCAWQILDLKRQTKGKSLIVPVDVEQKLILCFWGKNTESI